ncbi:CopG domain protein DNA-binding domain protein [Kalymmatonema gypsitolerans NIES-4073]|nr:CopG domain protein DNA-binding domain protein [Scytonema sp. NIES-4073]
MPREKILRVRLSDKEFEILREYAVATDMQISEVIRDYIKDLARLKKPS